MYSPVHAAVGVLIAQFMPDPVTALAAGAASHYVLDAIPHGDQGVGDWMTGQHASRRVTLVETLDLGTAALVTWTLISRHPASWPVTLAAGAIGGILPDLLWGARFLLKTLNWRIPVVTPSLDWHNHWHRAVHAHPHHDLPLLTGIAYQAIIVWLIVLLHL